MEQFKSDTFDPKLSFELEEASGEVDGKHIIGKVKGTFFVPNGTSRNKRFYSESLWKKQLARPSVQERLKNRRMFGTIGHELPIDDDAVRKGEVSHIMTDLQIKKGDISGYGEALILGTPAGHMLNTFLQAKAGMFTSSRALGKYQGVADGGVPRVDEDSYDLSTFDFVIDPGFLEANPQLAESYQKFEENIKTTVNNSNENKNGTGNEKPITETPNLDINEGEEDMTKDLLEKSMDEASKLRVDLTGALKEVDTIKEDNNQLKDENSHLKEDSTVLESYKELGSPEEIKEKLAKLPQLEESVKAFDELGTPERVELALDEAKKRIDAFNELGSAEKVGEALDTAKALLIRYQALGRPEQIDKVLEKFKTVIRDYKTSEDEKSIKALAAEIGVTEESVRKVHGKMSEDEIRKFFKDLADQNENKSRYTKAGNTTTSNLNENKENNGGDGKRLGAFDKSSGQRLMETFQK